MSLGLRSRLFGLISVACSVTWASVLAGGLVLADETSAHKRAEDLGLDEVLAESERDAGESTDASRRDAIAERAAALLLASDFWDRGEYATIRRLVKAAAPKLASLSEEQQAQLDKLLADMMAEDAASFEQLQARVALLNAAEKHDAAAVGAVENWLSTRDLSSLDVDQIAWCLAESLPHRSDVKEFTVVWEGMIAAPRTGKYEFSTTPTNVNREGREFVKHSIVASVGGVEVLRTPQVPAVSEGEVEKPVSRILARPAAPEWKSVGSTVALTGNQPTPIRIEMRYEASQPTAAAPASAILCWKGPGLERQPIAEKALAGPGGEQGGLKVEYRWSVKGELQAAVHESAAVDCVWLTPATVSPANPELVKRLSDRLWSLAASEAYLQRCAAGEVEHVFLRSPTIAGLLGSSRRQEFLEMLVGRPEFLQRVNSEQLLSLYRGFRFGAEEEVIDLLGMWMQQHADVQPEISIDFFDRNRRVYWELAQSLAQQADGLDRLRNEYLVMEGERCVLPVAYTLAYGYRNRPGEMALRRGADVSDSPSPRWLDLLNEKLADASIAGDARVNWLIAKAQALEVSNAAPGETAVLREDYLVSAEWLTEAHLIAEDQAIQRRVYAEEVARAVALDRREAVQELIRKSSGIVSGAEASSWMRAAEAASRLWQARQVNDAQASRAAYVKSLQRRREQAVARGNEQSIDRYDALLGRYGSQAN